MGHQVFAGLAQLVEHSPCKRKVVSSNPTSSTMFNAGIAQLVEHFLAKEDVESSSLFARSNFLYYERLLGLSSYSRLQWT